MKFKSNNQRKAVMAKLKNMNYRQLRPNADADGDGVINRKDCKPLDPQRQGFIHDMQIKLLKVQEERLETKREKEQAKLNDTLDRLKERKAVHGKKQAINQAILKRKQVVIDEISREQAQTQKLKQANQAAKRELDKITFTGKAKTFTKRVGIGVGRAGKAGGIAVGRAVSSKKAKKGYKKLLKKIFQ